MTGLTLKESKRICREYGLTPKNIQHMRLREGVPFDALIIRINDVMRRKATCAAWMGLVPRETKESNS